MATAQTVVMIVSILIVVLAYPAFVYGPGIWGRSKRAARFVNPLTRVGLVCHGVGLVFWAANWVSIDAGKGLQPMCTIAGCMLTGAGLALIIAGGKVRSRQ